MNAQHSTSTRAIRNDGSSPRGDSRSILFVDDDDLFADAAAEVLRSRGHSVQTANSLRDAREHDLSRFDCLVVDHQLPDGSGLTLASQVDREQTRVVLVSAAPKLEAAVEALRLGIADFLPKPVDFDSLLGVLRPRRLELVAKVGVRAAPSLPSFRQHETLLASLAKSRCPVLITGETGTGKGYLARTIHSLGQGNRPMVAINCAAVPSSLAESELFGVERGAFTGAERRAGLLEAADGGTLFLDEIGELSLPLQAKLLTFLDDGMVRRVGGTDTKCLSVRIIAATNRDLLVASRAGDFRLDLLHRLDVASIDLKPLRERREDLFELAQGAMSKLSTRDGVPYALAPDELSKLETHDWPGNIRELQNAIERSALVCAPGALSPSRFLRSSPARGHIVTNKAVELDTVLLRSDGSGDLTLATAEREHVLRVLDHCKGNRALASSLLGIGVSTLRRKLSEWSNEGRTPIG